MAKRKKPKEKFVGKCALCLLDRELRDSHIIPLSFFRDVIAAPHGLKVTMNVEVHNSRNRKGLHEYLLCNQCEGRIQRYEDEGKKILRNAKGLTHVWLGPDLWECQGLDYDKFKLFQISLFWRMSIAKMDEFASMTLGEHEEPMRKMLLTGDPGNVGDYGCLMASVFYNGKPASQFFFPPVTLSVNVPESDVTLHGWRMIVGGWHWHFFPHQAAEVPADQPLLFTQKNGSFVFPIQDIWKIEMFTKTMRSAIEAESQRQAQKAERKNGSNR